MDVRGRFTFPGGVCLADSSIRKSYALIKIFAGMLITLSGAIGFETLSNFVVPGSMYGILQIVSEEFCECSAAQSCSGGSYDLLLTHGFTYSLG
jgi:hypothetical protein